MRFEIDLTKAERDVIDERRAHVTREGWTPEHDDEHDQGELAQAAACYAVPTSVTWGAWRAWSGRQLRWPWARHWWKPKDRRSSLVKAAALLIAEIERLDRRP